MIADAQKEQIFRVYHDKVYGYILSKLHNQHKAEDLASDVFVKIYENIDRFDEQKASLSTWIYTITRNALTDYYRSRKVYEEIPETLAGSHNVEDAVCNAETLAALAKALQSLDARERDIIILRFYSGRTLKEIAENMGISYTYVKVLQNKAFDAIRKFIEKQ